MSALTFVDNFPPFEKDLKKLKKKYPSLPADISELKSSVIELFHIHKIDNQSIFKMEGFCSDRLWILKIKKIACKSLRGKGNRSGLRMIYAFSVLGQVVTFLEIYHKNSQENEDRERIKGFIKNHYI